jgi:hypothetical protein
MPSTAHLKSEANREARLTDFQFSNSYYYNYLAQQLSPAAAAMYTACMEFDKQTPGLRVWLKSIEGDYFKLNAFWVGGEDQARATMDKPPVLRNAEVILQPDSWPKAKTQEIDLQREDEKVDTFVGLTIGGQIASFTIPKKIDGPRIRSRVDVSDKVMNAKTTRASSTVCGGSVDSACIVPKDPNGYLVKGSGGVIDYKAGRDRFIKWEVTKDTPEQICVQLTVQEGHACEEAFEAFARATAIERYPVQLSEPTK